MAAWDVILNNLDDDGEFDDKNEEATRGIKRRREYQRKECRVSDKALELKDLKEEGMDPSSRSARHSGGDFRVPYPLFLELVDIVKERDWFPTGKEDVCGRPCIPVEHEMDKQWALKYAMELNARGDFFPVWGTCLGWEWMAQAFAGDAAVISGGFDAKNFTQPLGILPGATDSRMFSGFPTGLLEKASTEPLTANAHSKGVAPDDLVNSGLDKIFKALAVNEDRQGRTYVSAVEAFDSPMYGVQWHPEKSQFDWGLDPDGTPHHVINHSADAVQLSQVLSNFFASETRRNHHAFQRIEDWEDKMFHTREVTPTGPSTGQRYIFHWERDQQKAVLTSRQKLHRKLRSVSFSD